MVIVIVDNILNKCDKKITNTNHDSIYDNKDNIDYNNKNVNINYNNNDLNKNEVDNKDEDTKCVDTSSDNYIK